MGQKRLEKAIEQFAKISPDCDISVKWKPYQIDPGTAIEGEEFEAYNKRRWGGSGWTNHLKKEGQKDGAMFRNWKWWPNTQKAHCLVRFAKDYGISTSKSNAVIFHALYEEGKNISSVETLVDIGTNQLHLPEVKLRNFLEEDLGVQDLINEINRGRSSYRITGVPFFVVSREIDGMGPYGLSGAQSYENFLEIFKELEK